MKLGIKNTLSNYCRNEDGGVKIGFLGLLAILFIGLKLGGVIAWSWWWVLLPLYGPAAFLIGIFLLTLVGIGAGVGAMGASSLFRK